MRNFDKTISIIPINGLLGEGIKNWRGMKDAGGRRVKRSIYLDIKSIGFLTPEIVSKLERFEIMSNFLSTNSLGTKESLGSLNTTTNLKAFRYYLLEFLKKHPDVNNDDFLCLIRQLQSGRDLHL